MIVPPQFLAWGAPPPSWYIDDLMRFESRRYYVGLLKAAELHGATHQAVMEFQVVTDKQLPRIRVGRSVIAFYYRKNIIGISQGIQDRKTDTGRMRISSPELTALDLLRYLRAAAGLDNVASVLRDLDGRLDAEGLAALSEAFEQTIGQRLGHLLERLGHEDRVGLLNAALAASVSLQAHSDLPAPRVGPPATGWVEVDPSEAGDPDLAPEPVERDEKWRVVTRRIPKVDQ